MKEVSDDKMKFMFHEAMEVQNACNLSGVLFSFARHMQTLCDLGLDPDARNAHPVCILFSSKIASLTGSESMDTFSEAYQSVTQSLGDLQRKMGGSRV